MGRRILRVEQHEPSFAKALDEVYEGHLGRIAHAVEHRFAEECAAQSNAVQSAGQLPLVPAFDAMRESRTEEPCVRANDLSRDPGGIAISAGLDDLFKTRIHRHVKHPLPNLLCEIFWNVQRVQREDCARIRSEPVDTVSFIWIGHWKYAHPVSVQNQFRAEPLCHCLRHAIFRSPPVGPDADVRRRALFPGEPNRMKYRTKTGQYVFDLEFTDGRVLVDGREVVTSFVPAGVDAYSLLLDGRSARVLIDAGGPNGALRVTLNGSVFDFEVLDERGLLLERFGLKSVASRSTQRVTAPMPGLVRRVLVEQGQQVETGQGLLVLEAMKMENELRAEIDGQVHSIATRDGATVSKNDLLLEISGGV